MEKRNIFGIKRDNNKFLVLLFAILACVALSFYVGFVKGEEIVYTHFFYIPILLAGVWYRKKAIYAAVFLSIVYILVTHFSHQVVSIDNVERCAIFIAVAYVIGLVSEKRAKGEEEIRKEKNFSKNIITTVPDSLLVLDKDLKIKNANLSFYKVFQTEPEKVIDSHIADILGDKNGRLSTELTKLFGTGDMLENFEMKFGERIFNITARGMLIAEEEEEEEEEEELVVLEDITERKRAEEALKQLTEELESTVEERTKELKKERDYTRHLIESSPDFQLTVDREGKIIDVNEAFEKLVGTSRENIIGELICKFCLEKVCEKLIAEVVEKEKVRNIELPVEIAERGTFIVNFSGTVFTTQEGEEGVYITGRDMTELRAKEMQLIHTGRLSSLGEMATGIAHEINQPLSVISMAAESTLRDIDKNRFDISTVPRDLEAIMKNVKRIDRIIGHMRTFARKPGEIRDVKPEEVLNNAFILLGEQFRAHGISASREIEENLPLIKTDANQLEQVFVNILTNARQVLDEREEEATKKEESFDKRLVCRISRQRIEENEWIVYEFADNAFGVPEDVKTRVFEPFFTTKEAGEGTGLGLSIAYGIVTQSLSGKIWVEDNELGGASFKVAMPVTPENREQKSEDRR